MVHGNVGQSDLTREDMTRYIRYLVDVIGNEQKALYSYLENRTNPYICLHGECQTLADWISVLLEAYNQPFQRWDMALDLLVFDRLVNEMKPNEVPRQITEWYLYGLKDFPSDLRGRKYLHTVIEWDGLYWDANGGGTRQDKAEYYEGMTYWADGKQDRKRLLHNFFDWEEMKGYLEWPLVEESIDYTWHWTESFNREDLLPDELWIEEMGIGVSPYDNLGVFRDFIEHLRTDDFAAERIYFDDEYGGFIKGNPRANELPGEVLFPGEEERLAKIMSPEEFAELEQEVNLILSKNLPYNVESLSEDERISLHEDIIMKILNHEYIHQSIDDEVLEWAIENNKTKGDYYAAHEIMAYVDMALRESLGMRDFKLQLTSLVSQHPILTDNPELGDRIMDALTRTRKGQRFQIPAEIETLMRAFLAEDYEILVVGGAVRDMLMGLVPKDYDLATNATPEEVEVVVSKLERYRTVTTPEAQLARGVLTTLVLPPSGEVIEVTTFRAELGYEDGTRRPVAVAADTFYEDSLRRDFTMNALGWRLNGTILDYHEGVDDIEFGQLVAVGDASERLKEDPLRILRAVRFASRYGLEIDEELGAAIETNLPQLLTLSPERIRRELDTILKSEEGVYDLFETGILETIIPEYKGVYWGERHYDELPVITSVRSYGQIDRELSAYALLLQGRLTREEFNEQYRRGPISFSKAEADMIAELIELYSVALESEEPADIVAIVTSPHYAELMLMLEYTNRLDLVDYFTPYRQRYKGKPPKGYAMTVADEYGIEPGLALGERLSEITEAIILGDIEDWDEGLNYYAAESLSPPLSAFKLKSFAEPILTYAEPYGKSAPQDIIDRGWWMFDAPSLEWTPGLIWNINLAYDPEGVYNPGQFCSDIKPEWVDYDTVKVDKVSKEVGTRERIAYAGVILDEDTSEQLLAHFETLIPESWTRYAHHMTVSLGKSIPNQADLGKEVTLTVTAVGKSDDAIAVAVSGYPSRNAIPHITLAVPPGGKPFNSNKITDWHSVEPFEIQGQLQDVKTYVAEEIDTLHESLNYPRGFYSKRDNFNRFLHGWNEWYKKNMLDDFSWNPNEYMAETFESETVTKYSESFWGDAGSGVLVVARDTQRILLGLRSEDVNEPNTWGNFGGAIGVTDFGEPEEALPPEENALKEMAEEIGYTGAIEMIPSFTYRSPEFTYYNFIGVVDRESDVPLNQFNWEVSELRWFTLDEVMALSNLHFGVSALMRQEELVTLTAESVPMSDWSELSPVDLVELSQFPTGDDHMDGWDMYLPRDWPHWDVLERADEEYWQMEQKYLKDNDLKYLPWKERHKLPYTLEEIYAKYFDFWYIPSVTNSMSGGGRGQIYNSLKDSYSIDTWELESKKRGLPFNEHISLEDAAKYFSPQEIERVREEGRDKIWIYTQPVVHAFIDEYLDLGREGIFYAPVLAAAPVDAEVGTDASKEALLLDGWHRDAYANLLYDQDPSQGGAPTVFFKPKEEYL